MTLSLLGVAAVMATTFVGAVIAQAQAAPSGSVGIILSGTGASAAVGFAFYLARKVISGELVPLPIQELLSEVKESNRLALATNQLLEAQLSEAKAHYREGNEEARRMLVESTTALANSTTAVASINDYLARQDRGRGSGLALAGAHSRED